MTNEEYLNQLVKQRVTASLFSKRDTPEIRQLLDAGIPLALIVNTYVVAAQSKVQDILKEDALWLTQEQPTL